MPAASVPLGLCENFPNVRERPRFAYVISP